MPADILILYEHADRELDVACALTCLLATRHGLSARIIQHPFGQLRADSEMLWLKPKLVALPHCYRSAVHAPYVLDWPEAIYFNLMWEQVFYQGNRTAKIPHGVFSLYHVVHHAWGKFSAEYLQAASVPTSNIFLNGHPAYALYGEPYRRFYASRTELARRYNLDPNKRWVFFPENYNWAFYGEQTLEDFVGLGQKAEEVYAMRDFARASFAEAMRWCQAAAARGDVELIVRPRPATALEEFRSAVIAQIVSLPNQFHLLKDETVREWILASEVVVSSHSTSLIEATVAGKPAFMLTPCDIPAALAMEWHRFVPRLTTQAEFEAAALGTVGVGRDDRLRDWTRSTVMARGDAIANLAQLMAGLVKGSIARPPVVARKNIPTPQGSSIRNEFEFRVQQVRRKYQHASVQLRRRPVPADANFEKDMLGQAEIAARVSRWQSVLMGTGM